MLHLAAVLSVQATVQLHKWVKTFVTACGESWDIVKGQAITVVHG